MAVLLTRRFTLEEYHRLGEVGILHEDERVELIDGEIVPMTPIGPPHASVVARLIALLSPRFGRRAIVWPQNPVTLPRQQSEFQPDIVLLRSRADFYRERHPGPADALLVVEVMDSSAARDRWVKLPIYARGGVREVWLVDLKAGALEVHRRPSAGVYATRRVLHRRDSVSPRAFPRDRLTVASLIG